MTRFTSYEKNYILGRDAHCMCCGEVVNEHGETLYKGQAVMRISTPKAKKFAHEKCLRKMWGDGTDYELTSYNDLNSTSVYNHEVVIIAPKEETPYFGECGFEVLPYTPTHRRFVLPFEVNGYRSGHIVKRVLEKTSYRVFINGVQVDDHSEYRNMLGK